MIDATGLGGVVGGCAAGAAELVVEADGGGEGEEAGGDPCSEVVWGVGAVAFEGQEVFAGEEDRLDPLPDRGEVRPLLWLVAACGPGDRAPSWATASANSRPA